MPSVAVERILFEFGQSGASAVSASIDALNTRIAALKAQLYSVSSLPVAQGLVDQIKGLEGVVGTMGKINASVDSFTGALNSAVLKMSIFSAVTLTAADSVVKLGIHFAETGGLVNTANQVFEKTSNALGTTASELLPRLQNATMGAMSKFELMKESNFALAAGLKLSSDELVHLAEAATKLGLIVGMEPVDAFKRLVEASTRGSERMLAQLGVIVDSRTAFRGLAESMHENVNELTRQQRIAEMFKITMDAVNQRLAKFSDVNFQAETAGERMASAFKNFRDRLASIFVESGAAERLFQRLNTLLEGFAKKFENPAFADKFFDGLINGAMALLRVAEAILNILIKIAPYLDKIIGAFVGNLVGGAIGDTVGSVFEGIPIIGPIIKGVAGGLGRIGGAAAGAALMSGGEAGGEIGDSVGARMSVTENAMADMVRVANNRIIGGTPSYSPVG